MKIIPELLPNNLVSEVSFDERLVGLEFRDEADIEREQIDALWSNVFYAGLDFTDRVTLADDDIAVEGMVLHPSDYDLAGGKVGVVIRSLLSCQDDDNLYHGPAVYSQVSTAGHVTTEQGATLHYSEVYRRHIGNLLAETALSFQPLETDYL